MRPVLTHGQPEPACLPAATRNQATPLAHLYNLYIHAVVGQHINIIGIYIYIPSRAPAALPAALSAPAAAAPGCDQNPRSGPAPVQWTCSCWSAVASGPTRRCKRRAARVVIQVGQEREGGRVGGNTVKTAGRCAVHESAVGTLRVVCNPHIRHANQRWHVGAAECSQASSVCGRPPPAHA